MNTDNDEKANRRLINELRRRIRILEREQLRQAQLLTEAREQIEFMKSAPPIVWWNSQSEARRGTGDLLADSESAA